MSNKRSVNFYLSFILFFSIAINVGFAFKVRRLTLTDLSASSKQPIIGTRISAIDASDLLGTARHITFSSKKATVIYAFSPSCGWCAKNLENIKGIYRLKHSEVDFIGVSLSPDGIPEYLKKSGFPMDVVKEISVASKEKLRLHGTPDTIVIDTSGAVTRVWTGAYTARTCREIEQFFRLSSGTLTPISSKD